MSKTFIALSMLLASHLCATSLETNRILFLMQSGQVDEALNLYGQYSMQSGKHDLELAQQIGLLILEQGARSSDPETQLLTMFGAGISMNERVLYILETGLKSSVPQLQLVSLNLLAKFNSDEADLAIHKALTSNFLLIRLEGLLHLAEKKDRKAVAQTEALMGKVDKTLLPIFPEIFAVIGSKEAMRMLRKFLSNPDENVRIQAIASAAKHGRDDLLPVIRTLASQHSAAQQETCASAFGALKDSSSIPKLQKMSESGSSTLKVAALHALYDLGHLEAQAGLHELAKNKDLFAIFALSHVSNSEEILFPLTQDANLQVRANAAIALLLQKDPRCLPGISEILIRDSRDLAYTKISSPGKSLAAIKVIPSAKQTIHYEEELLRELSLGVREQLLIAALDLPEEHFLSLANLIFERNQNDLIPVLVDCLEEIGSDQAIALLKKYQQKMGAPLIRNYCNLALYRLKEEGPYADNLFQWVVQQRKVDLIRFRPLLPWESKDPSTPFQLNLEETSRLLVSAYEALAQSQSDEGIAILLHAIQYGNPKNKYALAGLLIRSSQ